MTVRHRIFSASVSGPELPALVEAVREVLPGVELQVEASERGWLRLDFRLPQDAGQLSIERFWRDEEGIRAELQAWAAWLEAQDSKEHNRALMERLFLTEQVLAIWTSRGAEDEAVTDDAAVNLCQFLARTADGVYQIDGIGFFAVDGRLLVSAE